MQMWNLASVSFFTMHTVIALSVTISAQAAVDRPSTTMPMTVKIWLN